MQHRQVASGELSVVRVVGPVGIRKDCNLEASPLVRYAEFGCPREVAKSVLRRHHVDLAGFRHRGSQLTNGIYEVVPQHLGNVHQAPHDALVALLFFLVQQSLVRLLVGEFETVPRRVGRLALQHSEPLQAGLGVSLLRDRESATLKVSLYLHAQDERYRSHVGHLETLLRLLFHHRHGVRVVAGQKEIVHVEGQVDPNTVVTVQVDTCQTEAERSRSRQGRDRWC